MPVFDQPRHLGKEEGHQKRRDMRAVDIGVGHDDDLFIAQVVVAIPGPHADAERLTEIVNLLVLTQLGRRRAHHVQDLAAQRQQRLRHPVPRHLGGAARAVALHQKQLRPLAVLFGAVDQLAGEAEFLGGGFALGFLVAPPLHPLFRALDEEIDDVGGAARVGCQPVVPMVAHRALDQPLRLRRRQAVLGLADEIRVADEGGDHRAAAGKNVVAGDLRRLLVVD